MHNNDIHSNLNNIPKTVTAVKEYRKVKPNSLFLNAGDVFSGTLYFNTFKGKADLALLNLLGYDAMTFGNHEFDLGSSPEGHQALVDFIEGSNYPFVSANVDFSSDAKFTGLFSDLYSSNPEKGKIYNGIVKVINGEKVGIFGLTTAETAGISSPGDVKFEDYLEEAKKAVKAFEGMGVNKIIALTHLGYDDNALIDNDIELAKQVKGIDIIVGGHSHTELKAPVVIDKDDKGAKKDPTVIVQAYQYNEYLGTLDVEFNGKGIVVNVDGKLIKVADYAEDANAVAVLKPFKDKVAEVSAEKIGVTLKSTLENPRSSTGGLSVRSNETILGNIVTDGMLAKAKTYDSSIIMALQNGGGIRKEIPAGDVTVGQVIEVLPFGNTLATVDITGKDLKSAFEHSLKQVPNESGGFLHISGGKVEFDSSKPAGQRVVKIYYKDANGDYVEIQDSVEYKIATNAFTAKGGDDFKVFEELYKANKVTDLGWSDWENLRDQLISIKDNIPTTTEGRIVDVYVPTVNADKLTGGTAEKPVQVTGNVIVDLSTVTSLKNVVFTGNVTFIGSVKGNLVIDNVVVKGNLDISALKTNISLENIKVEGLVV